MITKNEKDKINSIWRRVNNRSAGEWNAQYRGSHSTLYTVNEKTGIQFLSEFRANGNHEADAFFCACAADDIKYLIELIIREFSEQKPIKRKTRSKTKIKGV